MTPTAGLERIRTVIVDDHDELGRLVARRIAEVVRAKRRGGRAAPVLGLATGSTPIGVYRELIRLHQEEGLSFATVVTFNLDEYYPMDPGSVHSYHRFMWENLFAQLDIPPEQRPHPARRPPARRGRRPSAGATRRRSARPAGSTSSSSASAAPATSGSTSRAPGAESRTRLVTLDLVTRQDAAADFFGEENVPREAITMGVATILEAREIVILATGEHKAAIVRRAVEGEVDHEVAATFLQRHPEHHLLPRSRRGRGRSPAIATPWLLGAGRVDAAS